MHRLDGLPVANAILKQCAARIAALGEKGIVPKRAVVGVGDRKAGD